ncbi:bifunctional SulP family inorganic anion transporter/carbonic anhydrase [Nitrosococcus wardiae]|uniref:Sulfate transporter n=1 Tax=Nitrosococcus wardiae TaxID=1814290 RepID=A0A4P7C1S2_9GAMM|nr:SulP family inorganic anion transporter [Nitrosococcus wardiae]QBQ55424.1 sulfate transporter [Nitrosococcus wardiae]
MSNPRTQENPASETAKILSPSMLSKDLISGTVVFLVALPLCLGIALASGAPLFSGLVAGIVGGIVVGTLSGSHVSVSGPAAGLTAIVIAQIAALGSFEAFLVAVILGGIIQIGLGVIRAGFIAAFFPSSVIKGLLAAIGVILILKQIPHVFGHDTDPEGEMSFLQPDQETTFSALIEMFFDLHPGAMVIGLLSVALLVLWDRIEPLKRSLVPAPLLVVLLGVGLNLVFRQLGGIWLIETEHLVQVPVAESVSGFIGFLRFPDFSILSNPAVYFAAMTIALVASLETLLNLEAVDNLDPKRRYSPPSRELLAQGVGNVTSGILGGLPLTSVIIRGTVNINAGAQTKLSAIFHGLLLLVCVALFPIWLNMIPLSCLAAILLMTGFKLVSPTVVRQMYSQGRSQFMPFLITVVAIVLTDLLIGIVIGLVVASSFILYSSMRYPIRRIVETHLSGDVMHIELPNQVSFLNRAALANVFKEIPHGGHVLIDAQGTDYIDPDVLALIQDFKNKTAPIRGIRVSVIGFKENYQIHDEIQHVDYSTKELQEHVTPRQVLKFLKDGNERFRTGRRLNRYLPRQQTLTETQYPLAVVLSCTDSHAPTELIFDLGLGDVFSVSVAGNVIGTKVIGSIEYGCAVAGAKLVLVMGHTRCGAIISTVKDASVANSCQYLEPIFKEIKKSMDRVGESSKQLTQNEYIDHVARINMQRTVEMLPQKSEILKQFVEEGKIEILGAMYDVVTKEVTFMEQEKLSW